MIGGPFEQALRHVVEIEVARHDNLRAAAWGAHVSAATLSRFLRGNGASMAVVEKLLAWVGPRLGRLILQRTWREP